MKKSKIVGTVLTAICVLFCLSIVVEVIVANNNQRPPRFFGYSISYVPTNSMEPTINSGDYILFTKATFDDVEVNDVIIYRSNEGIMKGNFIVHRVKEKYDDYLIAKGDFNTLPDTERVTEDMVLGKFITTIDFLDIFSSSASRTTVFIILFLVMVSMIGLQFVSVIAKYKKDKLLLEQKQKEEKMIEELRLQILKEELEKLEKLKNEKVDV